jgi:sirohydrochlorin ferrochelatase
MIHRPGLLIVDHGTRVAASNARLAAFAREIAAARPTWLVQHAHMELAEPGFEAGIEVLVERGASEILVHLHFLGDGYHVRQTIPDLVARVRERHRTIPIATTAPLGDDPRLVEIVLGRMEIQSAVRDRQSSKE